MAISEVTSTINTASYSAAAPTTTSTTESAVLQRDTATTIESAKNTVASVSNEQSGETLTNQKQLSEDDFKNVTDELNNVMDSMNTDIHFLLHTKTNTLMIQVEDGKTHRLIKEFPAHDLLDMVSRLKDYVGALLDKKA